MKELWPKIPLKELLNPVSRPESVQPDKPYNLLGAHWYAQGLYIKETCQGSEIRASKVYRVEEGDFVYNRLFAWKGSFAIATKENHNCYVSNEFPCFFVNQNRINGNYLWRYFGQSKLWEEALGLSTGGTPTSRNRLKEKKLLEMAIPLPPLPEQRRIVTKIEELAGQINEARTLRQQAVEDMNRFLIYMAHRDDLNEEAKKRQGWKRVILANILRLVDDSHSITAEQSYPNLGIYSFGRGLFRKGPIDGALTSAKALRRVRKGQFIYSRLFAFEGAYGMVTDEYDGFFVSNEYPTFDCDCLQVSADFLAAHFKLPRVWKKIAAKSKGLGDRRQRVQPREILNYELWLPSLEWQNRIAGMQTDVKVLKGLHTETATVIKALLPSILDRAFKGEL